MKRLVTNVNDSEYRGIEEFCKKNDISVYALLKKALFAYLDSQGLLVEKEMMEEAEAIAEKLSEGEDFRREVSEKKALIVDFLDIATEIPSERLEVLVQTLRHYYELPPERFNAVIRMLRRLSEAEQSGALSEKEGP
ncbi:MAG: hypothetical protein LN416_01810 [Candidatus Thermoplasmatota archaeon]|nr:hypothetical protein [Candidatus Thermoplasmatota archaeon]